MNSNEPPSDSEYGCPICQACLPDMHEWELHLDWCENVNGYLCTKCNGNIDQWSETLCEQCDTNNNK